jgi:carbonic anhydrase
MNRLIQGVHRFYRDVYLPRREIYQRSLERQQPLALFVTCSDSRLDPQAHTQAGPGDLFVLRNAGNLIPPFGTGRGGEAATIEYAIAGLGIRNIIVCGHTHCGAIRALLEPESHAHLTETTEWLLHAESTRQIIAGKCAKQPFAERWVSAVEQNVLSQLENLRTHPVVAAGLAHGTLDLFGWVSDLEHGTMRSFDPIRGEFLSLAGGPDDEFTAVPPSIPSVMTVIRTSGEGSRNGQASV